MQMRKELLIILIRGSFEKKKGLSILAVPFGVSHTKPRIHRYNMVVFFFPEVLH